MPMGATRVSSIDQGPVSGAANEGPFRVAGPSILQGRRLFQHSYQG